MPEIDEDGGPVLSGDKLASARKIDVNSIFPGQRGINVGQPKAPLDEHCDGETGVRGHVPANYGDAAVHRSPVARTEGEVHSGLLL